MDSQEFIEEQPTISRDTFLGLMFDHGIPHPDFSEDFQVQTRYDTQTVMDWLGY